MRNRLAQQYFETDFEVVLNVLETEIDPLGETITLMLQELSGTTEKLPLPLPRAPRRRGMTGG